MTWIPRVTERGLVILAKDSFRLRHERLMIARCGARVFTLPNANMRTEEMVERFLTNHERIVAAASAGGPCHYSVGHDRLRAIELLR